jgi:hypothetical protein
MQFFVSFSRAADVMNNAPTLASASGKLGRHTLTVEAFDYGAGLGLRAGVDLRGRLLIDGAPVVERLGRPHLSLNGVVIWERTRPDWLPKGVTVATLNRTARALLRGAVETLNAKG